MKNQPLTKSNEKLDFGQIEFGPRLDWAKDHTSLIFIIEESICQEKCHILQTIKLKPPRVPKPTPKNTTRPLNQQTLNPQSSTNC